MDFTNVLTQQFPFFVLAEKEERPVAHRIRTICIELISCLIGQTYKTPQLTLRSATADGTRLCLK